MLFGNIGSERKSNHIVDLLQKFTFRSEENQAGENREIVKILIKASHYLIKHMMSNTKHTSLVKLISECGSTTLKKFLIQSPKNATYISHNTFSNILNVLNRFTEEPLLRSLQRANYVTLFHDETTDVSNHSEAAVFAMFLHEGKFEEHFWV